MSLPNVIAVVGAGSGEGNADSRIIVAGMGQADGDPPVAAAVFTGAAAAAATAEDTQHNVSAGSKSARRKYAQWSADLEYSLMAQAYEEQVHVARHGHKDKRFKAVADKLNSLPDFENVGGVSQSKMEERYKRLMAAHREKVVNGVFKSEERGGVPTSTQYLCNQMMKEEDKFLVEEAKTARTEEAQEPLANKEAKGKEVLAMTFQANGSRERRKLSGRGNGGSEQGGSPKGTPDDVIDLENTLAKYLESHTDDPETKKRKLKIKEDEAAAALMQATSFRDVAEGGSPGARKHKGEVEIEMIDAHTRKLQAMVSTRRPNIRDVQTTRRYGAICAGERVRIKLLLRQAIAMFIAAENHEDEEEACNLRHVGAMVVRIVCRMRRNETVLPATIRKRGPVIDDITDSEAWTNYRSHKPDLRRLFRAFNFSQETFRTGSNHRYPSESAFLLLIRRMRHPGRWQDLQQEFGREYTQLSRIFNGVVDWVYDNHLHRVTGCLGFLYPRFPQMCRKIEAKGGMACAGGNFIGFIDRTLRRNCRPGGEPAVQEQMYDGHNCAHSLAWQSVVFADGMIEIWGPEMGWRPDSLLLSRSGLNGRLAALQAGNPVQYKVYGDAAYPICSHVDRGFRGANLTDAQKAYNRELSNVRVSVEYQFGKIVAMFPFIDLNLKIRLQPVAKYFAIAVLLTNAHTCLFGSITGDYFDMQSPALEAYFTF